VTRATTDTEAMNAASVAAAATSNAGTARTVTE
jgi:hypothetical protein